MTMKMLYEGQGASACTRFGILRLMQCERWLAPVAKRNQAGQLFCSDGHPIERQDLEGCLDDLSKCRGSVKCTSGHPAGPCIGQLGQSCFQHD